MTIMAKAKAVKTAKKGKRGRPEKRLIITEDPTAALERLLKPPKK